MLKNLDNLDPTLSSIIIFSNLSIFVFEIMLFSPTRTPSFSESTVKSLDTVTKMKKKKSQITKKKF